MSPSAEKKNAAAKRLNPKPLFSEEASYRLSLRVGIRLLVSNIQTTAMRHGKIRHALFWLMLSKAFSKPRAQKALHCAQACSTFRNVTKVESSVNCNFPPALRNGFRGE